MKKISIIFLQIVILLVGASALAALIIFPQNEGRNINADLTTIYFKDPFLSYVYLGSTAFFVAVYNAFKLLNYTKQNEIFSLKSIKALQTVKYCALTIIGFIIGAEAYLFTFMRGRDDITGGVALGFFILFISLIVLAIANTAEKILQSKISQAPEK